MKKPTAKVSPGRTSSAHTATPPAGRAGMAHTLHDPRWLQRQRSAHGVHVFDLNSDKPFST